MGQIALNFLASHQQLFAGIVLGALASNPGWCATTAFGLFVRVPFVGPWIAANPDKAKAWADGFDKAIDECIDKYANEKATAIPNPNTDPRPPVTPGA